MFLLNGTQLAQGTAFTADGIQYPANWLNLTTLAEKEAIGITEVADARRYDDRFYWDGDITNPKAFMFIISLSTYVANHGNPYIDGTFIILGSAFGTLFWFTAVSFLFGRATIRNIFYKKQRFINIIFGLILLYVASRIVIL